MILDEYIDVKINSINSKRFIELGYSFEKVGDIITIHISHIAEKSHHKIKCKCDICGVINNIQYKSYSDNIRRYNLYTCSKCSIIKNKRTNLERIGCEFPSQSSIVRDKYKKTIFDKYGVENILLLQDVHTKAIENSKTIESKNKRVNTSLENWGVDNPSKSDIIKYKTKNSNLNKYGVEFPSMLDDVKSKFKKSILDNTRSKYTDLKILNSLSSSYFINCDKCSKIYEIDSTLLYWRYNNLQEICTICNTTISNHCSNFEGEVYDFISSIYDGDIKRSFKYKGKKEIDIYLEDLNIGIECNGVFWHSEKFKHKDYHLCKYNDMIHININLINIWEDDWKYKRNIIKSIIRNRLKKSIRLYARKCEIKLITDSKLSKTFLENNHIQGYSSSKYKLGLFLNGELVSLMCFSKKRKEMELVRFCNLLDHNVIGAASKIFLYFIKNTNYNKIISYADNSIFDGGLYYKLGFKFEHQTKPNYWWIVDDIRKHRFNFSKKKLNLLGNKNKTEFEFMSDSGHYRLFGVGLSKFVYKK